MPSLRKSYRTNLALALIAVVASTGLGSGVVCAQTSVDPRSNVIVDLTVIDDGGYGPSSGMHGSRSDLAMPGRKPPVSRLHGPTPMPVEAPSLTPPTETRQRLTLSPPRPQTRMVTRPRSLAIEIARVPRPVTAPSRTGAMVAPLTTPAESLGTPASMPPPPQWTQPAGTPTVSKPIPEPARSEPVVSAAAETPAPSSEPTSLTPSTVTEMPPPAPEVVETSPPETATTRAPTENTAEKDPPPIPPMAKTVDTETPLPVPAAKAPPPPSAGTEQAMLPPQGAAGAAGGLLQIPFAAGDTELAVSGQEQLDGLARYLTSVETLRVQLLAYAGDEGASPSKARRVSLSRALAVRSYLIESGIKTSRIDVRALGNKATSGSPDRVDVKVIER